MSVADKLREYAKDWGWLDMSAEDTQEWLEAIADYIDAEHEAKVFYWQCQCYKDGCDAGFARADDWLAQHEDAMAEHGWVRLPKDADGEYISIGNVMEFTYDPPQDQPLFEVSGFGADGTLFYAPRGEVFPRKSTKASVVRHHHAPTVEDVLREFAQKWIYTYKIEQERAVIAEYAAKLRLAGGDAE